MFGLQTIGCLHDIPLVRASTEKLHNVYAKAKGTSILIRLPCSMAESVADKGLKVAVTIASPFFSPFKGPVHMLDDLAAHKLRQMEAKVPIMNMSTKEVVETFNERTEPMRQAMNNVKDTTTSTLQHGKETVSHVADAVVHKATDVADSVYSFCEAHGPGKAGPVPRNDFGARTSLLSDRLKQAALDVFDYFFRSARLSTLHTVIWFRILLLFVLHRVKATNDFVVNKLSRQPLLFLSHWSLVRIGSIIQSTISWITPDDRAMQEFKKKNAERNTQHTQQRLLNEQQHQQSHSQTHHQQQQQQHPRPMPAPAHVSQQQHKGGVTTRQSIVTTHQETSVSRTGSATTAVQSPSVDFSNMTDTHHLHARLACATVAANGIDAAPVLHAQPTDRAQNPDIARLHNQIKPSDMELLYSKLPVETLPSFSDEVANLPLTADQQQLHARIIGKEIDHQNEVGEEEELDL